jgi:hypothetical protein
MSAKRWAVSIAATSPPGNLRACIHNALVMEGASREEVSLAARQEAERRYQGLGPVSCVVVEIPEMDEADDREWHEHIRRAEGG